MSAEVTKSGALAMQVCVPAEWTDQQVKEFADGANMCGTEVGWQIRKVGDPCLGKDPERQPCGSRAGHVHIMLDA